MNIYCTRCKSEITENNKHYKYINTCKKCVSVKKLDYERKKENICQRLFWHECQNSKKRNHSEPAYTKEELCKWVNSQDIFHSMYDDWVNSNYNSELKISIDRLDNKKPYSFNNIELVTWRENKIRANKDKLSGKFCNQKQKVYQYAISGELVGVYHSQAEAERCVPNSNQQNISSVCYGKMISHAGFRWFFEPQINLKNIRIRENYERNIYMYSSKTGVLIKKYNSLTELLKHNNKLNDMSIRATIRGVNKSHLGFWFSFDLVSEDFILKLMSNKKKKYIKIKPAIKELLGANHLPEPDSL